MRVAWYESHLVYSNFPAHKHRKSYSVAAGNPGARLAGIPPVLYVKILNLRSSRVETHVAKILQQRMMSIRVVIFAIVRDGQDHRRSVYRPVRFGDRYGIGQTSPRSFSSVYWKTQRETVELQGKAWVTFSKFTTSEPANPFRLSYTSVSIHFLWKESYFKITFWLVWLSELFLDWMNKFPCLRNFPFTSFYAEKKKFEQPKNFWATWSLFPAIAHQWPPHTKSAIVT